MRPIANMSEGLNWFVSRIGVCKTNHIDVVACIGSGSGIQYLDLQDTPSPVAVNVSTWAPLQEYSFQIHVGLMRAHRRAWIALYGPNQTIAPRLQ